MSDQHLEVILKIDSGEVLGPLVSIPFQLKLVVYP
jgi:hypothetical protein